MNTYLEEWNGAHVTSAHVQALQLNRAQSRRVIEDCVTLLGEFSSKRRAPQVLESFSGEAALGARHGEYRRALLDNRDYARARSTFVSMIGVAASSDSEHVLPENAQEASVQFLRTALSAVGEHGGNSVEILEDHRRLGEFGVAAVHDVLRGPLCKELLQIVESAHHALRNGLDARYAEREVDEKTLKKQGLARVRNVSASLQEERSTSRSWQRKWMRWAQWFPSPVKCSRLWASRVYGCSIPV